MKQFLIVLLLFFSTNLMAELPGVREWQTQQPLNNTYKSVNKSLQNNRFWVVFKASIFGNLERFAERSEED